MRALRSGARLASLAVALAPVAAAPVPQTSEDLDIDPQGSELQRLVGCGPLVIELNARSAEPEQRIRSKLEVVDQLQCRRRHEEALELIRSALPLPASFQELEQEFKEREAFSMAILVRKPDMYLAACRRLDAADAAGAAMPMARLRCHRRASAMLHRARRYGAAAAEAREARAVLVAASGAAEPDTAEAARTMARLLRAEAAAHLAAKDAARAVQPLAESLRIQWRWFFQRIASLPLRERNEALSDSDNPLWVAQVLEVLPFQSPAADASDGLFAALIDLSTAQAVGRADRAVFGDDPSARAEYNALLAARRRFAAIALGALGSAPRTHIRDELVNAAAEVSRAERRLRGARASRLPKPVTPSEVSRALRPSEVAIQYLKYFPVDLARLRDADDVVLPPPFSLAARYGAYLITADGRNPRAIDLGPVAEIDEAIHAYRGLLEDQQRTGALDERLLAEAGSAVGKRVVEPILRSVPSARRVFVAPAGSIARVPFEVIPLQGKEDEIRYVAEALEIAYLDHVGDLVAENPARGGDDVWIVASPDYGPQSVTSRSSSSFPEVWRPLDSAELVSEAVRLGNQVGVAVRTLQGMDASESNVLAIRSPRAILFATHGYLLDRPIRFADPDPVRIETEKLLSAVRKLSGAWRPAPGRVHAVERREKAGRSHPGTTEVDGASSVSNTAAPEVVTLPDLRIRNPLLRSFLVLANANRRSAAPPGAGPDDGILTALEILEMNLEGTELVVLGACESGLAGSLEEERADSSGNYASIDADVTMGEAVTGLRGAFRRSGARALVVSLWKIPLRETQRQLKDLLDGWLGRGLTPFEAFRASLSAALSRAREEHGNGHPFWWGGLTFAGVAAPASSR